MSQRLYYTDSYLKEFTATLTEQSPDGSIVYLDRTAFYPTSGGQPFDTGSLGGIPVVEVAEEADGRVAHRLAVPLPAAPVLTGEIDWARRFDHMQQHTGQHLLSAVFEEAFGLHTVSFHLGAESCTIDLEGGALDSAAAAEAECRANAIITEDRQVSVAFEDGATVAGLRKPSDREGTLRIVSIDGLDRSACGGTHVRRTGEIGALLVRRLDKIRQSVRVEFLCGARAIAKARADFEALTRTAQLFSSPLEEVPKMAASQMEMMQAGEKARRKLELDLAGYRGAELYRATEARADGLRVGIEQMKEGSLEQIRAVAQSFTALPKALFVATLANPPSVLLAASSDSGVDAGRLLKEALAAAGGRGGGTARIAQGSVPAADALGPILEKLTN